MGLQVAWFVSVVFFIRDRFSLPAYFMRLATIALVIYVLNKRINPSYKLTWTLLLMAFPVVGLVCYTLFGQDAVVRGRVTHYHKACSKRPSMLHSEDEVVKGIQQEDPYAYSQMNYIKRFSGFPAYHNEGTKYYGCGEDALSDLLDAIREAKHYVFLEYFIISPGKVWNKILEILQQKVKEGVEVRVMYDDVGSCNTIPVRYWKKLEDMGIACRRFHPLRFLVAVFMNNRDHRKILVADGKVAFTGGINLADEYMNEKVRFGYWKDAMIRVEGEPVSSFVEMFLEHWNYAGNSSEDFSIYFPKKKIGDAAPQPEGYVQPFGDDPYSKERLAENVYMNIIYQAKRYVYIFTPYLLTDNEFLLALEEAANRGVDVRLMMPGVPDKKIIYYMARSSYIPLLQHGVRIFHYSPGFLHSKCFVADDECCVVGSINLDYRSLYLHFEDGVYCYKAEAVMQLKRDFLNAQAMSQEIDLEYCYKMPYVLRVVLAVLMVLAPLL